VWDPWQDKSDSGRCSSTEEIDQGNQTDSDNLFVTQFESPVKKVFMPNKKSRVDQLSDDDIDSANNYDSEKEDCTSNSS